MNSQCLTENTKHLDTVILVLPQEREPSTTEEESDHSPRTIRARLVIWLPSLDSRQEWPTFSDKWTERVQNWMVRRSSRLWPSLRLPQSMLLVLWDTLRLQEDWEPWQQSGVQSWLRTPWEDSTRIGWAQRREPSPSTLRRIRMERI